MELYILLVIVALLGAWLLPHVFGYGWDIPWSDIVDWWSDHVAGDDDGDDAFDGGSDGGDGGGD